MYSINAALSADCVCAMIYKVFTSINFIQGNLINWAHFFFPPALTEELTLIEI